MSNILREYKNFRASDVDLRSVFGDDLTSAQTEHQEIVYCADVTNAIKKYLEGAISYRNIT